MRNLIYLGSILLAILSGCGDRRVTVEGEVTLEGRPVAGATVTFTSEDGSKVFSGMTDESGKFSLGSAAGPGAVPGSYKVTVAKYAPAVTVPVTPSDESDPSKMSKDYLAQMKKYADMSKAGAKGPMPPMPGKVGGGASGPKSELPEVYARLDTTPLRVTIPSSGPVKLELQKSQR
jgi:hypothetical protein